MARSRKTAETEESPPDLTGATAETVVLSEPLAVDQTTSATAPDRSATTPQPAMPRRRGMSVLLGGAIAAMVGAGATVLALPRLPASLQTLILPATATVDPRIEEQASILARLEKSVADLAAAPRETPDLSATLSGLDDLSGRLAKVEADLAQIADATNAIEPRLAALEKRPVQGGAASSTAIDALSREIEALKGQMTSPDTSALTAEIEAAAASAAERIAAAEESAARLAAAAEEAGRTSAALAAVSHVEAALESGAPIHKPLSDLAQAGIAVPAALSDQAQGVPSLAMLQESFVEAARDALVLSVRETAGEGVWSRLGAFLRSQTGARSLTPRAGTDPDAVLSRAEAAVANADLATAITELDGLPEQGKARMAEWITLAERRIAALAAVADLSSAIDRGK